MPSSTGRAEHLVDGHIDAVPGPDVAPQKVDAVSRFQVQLGAFVHSKVPAVTGNFAWCTGETGAARFDWAEHVVGYQHGTLAWTVARPGPRIEEYRRLSRTERVEQPVEPRGGGCWRSHLCKILS